MIKYIKVNKIQNPEVLSNVIFNNFSYLTEFPELMHTKKEITNMLCMTNTICYLVYDGDKLIGYLVGDARKYPDGRYGYYVSYLYVAKNYRNKKIGSDLMDMLINEAKSNGVGFILLTCDTNDEKVVNFYIKYGFKVDSSLGNGRRHNVYSLSL